MSNARLKPTVSLIGRRMRQARERRDMSQFKLGVEVGLDEATSSPRISRYESGVHEPPLRLTLKMAEILGVPLPFFYCDNDDLAEMILMVHELSGDDKQALKHWLQNKSGEVHPKSG